MTLNPASPSWGGGIERQQTAGRKQQQQHKMETLKNYTVINHPEIEGQFAVTRPVPRKQGMYKTAFYRSMSAALKAKGRIGIIAKVINKQIA